MNMDIYLKTPGSTLIGLDRITFDSIKVAVDKATNEFLIRPDWDANLRVVELIQSVNNLDLLHEVTLLLRRKLRASQPKMVVITLRLMESLTTNCGRLWFHALNAEPVTRELANVARKFVAKTGVENKEVTDTVLDLVQAWGEAFLTQKKEYPNIVELYFTLRKEGLPFKVNNQFDPSRVPIFTKPGTGSGSSNNEAMFLDAQTDAILAATIQASMELNQDTVRRNSASAPPARATSGNSRTASSSTTSKAVSEANHVVESLGISMTILKDLIVASSTISELKGNDVIREIVEQIRSYQSQIHQLIESTMSDPEVLAKLFQFNDYSQTLLTIYSDIKDGGISLAEGKTVISSALNFDEDTKPAATSSVPATMTTNLLDYDDDVSATATKSAAPSGPAVSTHHTATTSSAVDLDFFSTPSVPVASAVNATNSSQSAPVAATPQVSTNTQPVSTSASRSSSGATIPRLAPPPSGKVPFLAPPPKAGATVGRSNSITSRTSAPVAPTTTADIFDTSISTAAAVQPAATANSAPAGTNPPVKSSASELLDLFSEVPSQPVASTATPATTNVSQPFAAFPPNAPMVTPSTNTFPAFPPAGAVYPTYNPQPQHNAPGMMPTPQYPMNGHPAYNAPFNPQFPPPPAHNPHTMATMTPPSNPAPPSSATQPNNSNTNPFDLF